jgi:membrane protein DedA with SNARE-associated domain
MIPFVQEIKPLIYHYGYWAVFFGVFLESFGMPLPGETLIIVAGLLAAKGVLDLKWVELLAIAAAFIANNISYVTGYWGGRALVIKYGKYVFINEKKLLALENFMKLHGSKVVLVARFILGLRQFNGFIAGMARMPFLKFGIFNLIGAILWVLWWTGLAYYFGKKFTGIFVGYYFFIGILTLVVLIALICRFLKKIDLPSPLIEH